MPTEDEFTRLADPYRRELLAHCYRMVGSLHDAEDLVQETYLRAWRGYADFEGRSSLRTWLHRIATRVCLTALRGRERRVLPAGLGGATEPGGPIAARLDAATWVQPIPDAAVFGHPSDPATIVERRETTRLAFVAALQHLPPRQRAVLLLHDVLDWRADELAELLDTSKQAVNSALQRARAHLARLTPRQEETVPDTALDAALLDSFLAAFERADVAGLARLMRDDVVLQMPPTPTWFAGRDAVIGFLAARAFPGRRWRLLPTAANGFPAFAAYLADAEGAFRPHSLHMLETRGGAVAGLFVAVDAGLFPAFGLPDIVAA